MFLWDPIFTEFVVESTIEFVSVSIVEFNSLCCIQSWPEFEAFFASVLELNVGRIIPFCGLSSVWVDFFFFLFFFFFFDLDSGIGLLIGEGDSSDMAVFLCTFDEVSV